MTATNESTNATSQRAFLAGLFVTTFATLCLEVLFTRLLSVLTWYSLAFLVIAMGLFGMTAGALVVYFRPIDRDAPEMLGRLGRDAARLGWAIPISYVLLLLIPLRVEPVLTTVVLFVVFAAVLALPFVASGMVVASALTRTQWPLGRIYAVDLAGAALGAVAMPLLLRVLDGGSAILFLGVLAGIASLLFAFAAGRSELRRSAWVVIAVCGALVAINAWMDRGLVPLWVKGSPEDRSLVVLERWNSHARVQVSRAVKIPGALWGAGTKCKPPKIEQRLMVIDGDAATPLYSVKDSLEELRFLDCDVTNVVHQLRSGGPMAIIGVGGSRDVQTALLHEHRPVVGIEFNGVLLDVLRGPMGAPTKVPNHAGVTLVHDEARSYLSRTNQKFQVIQASLIDTWAATGAGAHALGENGLYTVEAWQVFLDRLEPRGVLSVSRWASGESVRLIPLAMAALFEHGVKSPRDHLLLVRGGRVTTLLISPDPFTAEDLQRLDGAVEQFGFELLVTPSKHELNRQDWLAAPNREALEERTLLPGLDFRPPTDDRPFFFNVVRPSAFWHPFPQGTAGNIEGNATATGALVLALFASLVLSMVAIVLPLVRRRSAESGARANWKDASLLGGVGYFACIGVGFMLCEIGLLQRLSLVLGHPSYSLMVVLASLVGAAGIGSWVSDRLPLDRRPWCYVFPFVAGGLVLSAAFVLPAIAPRVAPMSTMIRAVIAGGMSAGIGISLGLAFPAGMRIFGVRFPAQTPWFWGVNGVGSVLASSFALLIALGWGLRWLFVVSACCYVLLVPLLALGMRKPHAETAADPRRQDELNS